MSNFESNNNNRQGDFNKPGNSYGQKQEQDKKQQPGQPSQKPKDQDPMRPNKDKERR